VNIKKKNLGGRPPSKDPKIHRHSAKLNADEELVLKAYSQQEHCSEAEAIRRGVRKLKQDLNESK
jgi:hypothetical protein